eukprot:449521-Prorocentrum_minimum.AAC.1
MFQDMGRDPTNVELFDIAQSNSEHSRHWFFKANLVLDGEKLPYNLFELVGQTLTVSPPPPYKGTLLGVVYRARGPAPRWQLGGPASELAYEVAWATAFHLRPPLSYPRSYITLINAVPAHPSQHGLC